MSKLIEIIFGSAEFGFLAGTILYGVCFSVEWLIAESKGSRTAESYRATEVLLR